MNRLNRRRWTTRLKFLSKLTLRALRTTTQNAQFHGTIGWSSGLSTRGLTNGTQTLEIDWYLYILIIWLFLLIWLPVYFSLISSFRIFLLLCLFFPKNSAVNGELLFQMRTSLFLSYILIVLFFFHSTALNRLELKF